MDPFHNDVKCGFEILHEILLALEKCRANQILCNMNFSAYDVIIRSVHCVKIKLVVNQSLKILYEL